MKYLFADGDIGVMQTKADTLLTDRIWRTAFYMHILWGGLALLSGWSQFSAKLRRTRIDLHRRLGMIYLIAVLFSGTAGVYIGFFATGGIIPSTGFISLGILWLFSTGMAFYAVSNKQLIRHQKWMIVSFALCFAAVTLRLWLPLLISIFGEFIPAYRIVAWLCWVPNLFIAIFLVRRIGRQTVGV